MTKRFEIEKGHREFSAYEPSETIYTDGSGFQLLCDCGSELDTCYRCPRCGKQYRIKQRGGVTACEN